MTADLDSFGKFFLSQSAKSKHDFFYFPGTKETKNLSELASPPVFGVKWPVQVLGLSSSELAFSALFYKFLH